MKKRATTRTRRYRQTARASAAEATGDRILSSVLSRVQQQWFEEVTLDAVAKDAGVTVQTVIRRFGTKDQLLEAAAEQLSSNVLGRRTVASGDIGRYVDVLTADYETVGDLVCRLLAQEERYPALRAFCDRGRREHRDWLGHVFRPWLDELDAKAAAQRLDALVAATDLYLWKLIRRDMRRSIGAYKKIVFTLLGGVLPGVALPEPSAHRPSPAEPKEPT